MTYDEFIKKHNGVAVNYDGAAGKQCVDLATAYFNEVFGSGIKNFWYDAHHFWDLFDKNTWLKANFTNVKNNYRIIKNFFTVLDRFVIVRQRFSKTASSEHYACLKKANSVHRSFPSAFI